MPASRKFLFAVSMVLLSAILACGAPLEPLPALVTAMPSVAAPTPMHYPTLPPEWTATAVVVAPTYTPRPTYTPYPTEPVQDTQAAPTRRPTVPAQATVVSAASTTAPAATQPGQTGNNLDALLLANGFAAFGDQASKTCNNQACSSYVNGDAGLIATVYADGGLSLGLELGQGYSSAQQHQMAGSIVTQGFNAATSSEMSDLVAAWDAYGGQQTGQAAGINIQVDTNYSGDLLIIGLIPWRAVVQP